MVAVVFIFFSFSTFAQTIIGINGAGSIYNDNKDFHQDITGLQQLFSTSVDQRKMFLYSPESPNRAKYVKDLPLNMGTLQDDIISSNPTEDIIFYMTDHGARENNQSYALMGDYAYKGDEIAIVTTNLQASTNANNVIGIFDFCYSGGMLPFIFKEPNNSSSLDLNPKTCGIAASSNSGVAWIGESFMKVISEKIKSSPKELDQDNDGYLDLHEAFDYYERSYKTLSTPYSTSDIFLKKYYDIEAPKHQDQLRGGRASLLKEVGSYSTCHRPLINVELDSVDYLLTKLTLSTYYDNLMRDIQNHYNKFSWANDETSIENFAIKTKAQESKVEETIESTSKKIAKLEEASALLIKFPKEAELNIKIENLTGISIVLGQFGIDPDFNSENDILLLSKDLSDEQKTFVTDKLNDWKSLAPEVKELSKEMEAHVKKQSMSDEMYEINKSITAQYEKLRVERDGLSALRRLEKTIVKANAINLMVENNDTKNMKRFMGLLECESTKLRKL